MRMWNVDPKLLCRQHLIAEHCETHMFYGTIKKGISIKGYLDKGLIEVHNLESRHDELSKEMESRGYKHNSPWPEKKVGIFHVLRGCVFEEEWGKVNSEENIKILKEKCPECRRRMECQE